MKKFSGKCFTYKARNLMGMRVEVSLGGEDGFSIERNKISPRWREPHDSMSERQLTLSFSRGKNDEDNLWNRNLTTGSYTSTLAKEDTTKGRRINDKYN